MKLENITKKAIQTGAIIVAAAFGSGCGDDGGNEDTTPPVIQETTAMQDDYEGSNSIGLNVTDDDSGVNTVVMHYRADGSTDAYLQAVLTSAGGSPLLPSDELEFFIRASDVAGNVSDSALDTVEVYALNAAGCSEIEAQLAAYLSGGNIHDWAKDKVFSTGVSGEERTAEYAVLVKNPSFPSDPNEGWWVAVFYDGEGESAESGALNTLISDLNSLHFVESAVIGPAAEDRIAGLVDDALAADFAGGSYKSLPASQEASSASKDLVPEPTAMEEMEYF